MSELVFTPSLFFGFQLIEGKQLLHQMWVRADGMCEWRLVPMLEIDKPKGQTIAGYIPEEEDKDA